MAAASEECEARIRALLPLVNPGDVQIDVVRNHTWEILRQAEGGHGGLRTAATLDTALMDCPMIVVYKMARMTYEVGRRAAKYRTSGWSHRGRARCAASSSRTRPFPRRWRTKCTGSCTMSGFAPSARRAWPRCGPPCATGPTRARPPASCRGTRPRGRGAIVVDRAGAYRDR